MIPVKNESYNSLVNTCLDVSLMSWGMTDVFLKGVTKLPGIWDL